MEKYEQRGVSAGKEEVHAAVKELYHGLYPKSFCKIYPDYLGSDDAFCTAMSSDGSGTSDSETSGPAPSPSQTKDAATGDGKKGGPEPGKSDDPSTGGSRSGKSSFVFAMLEQLKGKS